jgi:hypothetical protein
MTMLFHSGAPLFLWVKAFSTAVYLINRLPTFALYYETPYFTHYGNHPDLAPNVSLTHGIHGKTSLIQKQSFAYL